MNTLYQNFGELINAAGDGDILNNRLSGKIRKQSPRHSASAD